MTVSVKTPAKPTPKKKAPTLQSRLDDALADAAGLEVAIEDEQKKSAELEAKLNSISSGVEYAEEYAEHNKKRNEELGKLRRRLERRDDKISTLEAEKTNHDDHVADLEEQRACAQRLVLGLEQVIDQQSADLDEANNKIAEQAQEIVGMRDEAARFYEANIELGSATLDAEIRARDLEGQIKEANAESAHNAQAARLLTEQVDALELTLEKQHAALTDTITARGARIDDIDLENEELRAENARLKAAEYLHKRPSAVRGALSAVRIARNLFGRGGVR